jgi:hypothetical protein
MKLLSWRYEKNIERGEIDERPETKGGRAAELANASVVHPRDPGSNLGTDTKYFLILFLLHLNSNL